MTTLEALRRAALTALRRPVRVSALGVVLVAPILALLGVGLAVCLAGAFAERRFA